MEINNVRIKAINTVVPPEKINVFDELDNYEWTEKQLERIVAQIGIHYRHIVKDETTLDLMRFAAKDVLQNTNTSPENIDAIICVTQTPDYIQPANACILQGQLGLKKNCLAFDINLGCSGFVYGLSVAASLINSLQLNNVLLLCGDTISKLVDKNDQKVAPLFGDAASACLIEPHDKSNMYFSLNTDGRGYKNLIVEDGGFKKPVALESSDLPKLTMDGNEIMIFSITEEPKEIKSIMEQKGLTEKDIDYLILHQANRYIISNIAKRVAFPLDKVPHDTISRYGNTSSASIPTAINDKYNKSLENQEKRVILSGFGVGLSWASCYTVLCLDYCPEILIYDE